MRWRVVPKIQKKSPQHGDYRTRRVFAWIPTLIFQNQMVWLEFYRIHEKYIKSALDDPYWEEQDRSLE
jgi:hypothetical protein